METDGLALPSPHSLSWSQGVSPHPPQRLRHRLVERPIGSGVTVCGWIRGQRFADSSLGGIDPVGEVTELPRAVGMGWWSARWTR